MQPEPPPIDPRPQPRLGVEVRDESTAQQARLVLASNWFAVDGLQITRRSGDVQLHRDGQLIARSIGGDLLFIAGHRLKARKAGFWRPVWTLPLGDGLSAEIIPGRDGVAYKHLRVMPGDARLDVVGLGGGEQRGCRIELVDGQVHADLALRCLVYFLAEIEEAWRR